jgi:hypothetical protein
VFSFILATADLMLCCTYSFFHLAICIHISQLNSDFMFRSQMSNSSFTAFDYMDQSSQMSRSSCRSDWLTEKDLVVGGVQLTID